MTECYTTNLNHPNNYVLTQVPDIDVETMWALQTMAKSNNKGLIAKVSDPITFGFLEDNGFKLVSTTAITKMNIRDYVGDPVVTVNELESDLKQELLILLRDHYERIHRVNPASQKINYTSLTFENKQFDSEHSIVRLSQQHIVAAILIFKDNRDFQVGWSFGDDVSELLMLWRDLLGILPVGNVLHADFDDTDVIATVVYDAFVWRKISTEYTLLWQSI
ncbi:hypothetical protein [Leuconostoc miyukkimchii]|uniref:hypothetical protein n=1 Tax=Leuconostoc miyukkimchii TaxID=910540 RepID=UPI001C7D2504|nr:hypothetical protein [Leuconostoc miyukkimchii]